MSSAQFSLIIVLGGLQIGCATGVLVTEIISAIRYGLTLTAFVGVVVSGLYFTTGTLGVSVGAHLRRSSANRSLRIAAIVFNFLSFLSAFGLVIWCTILLTIIGIYKGTIGNFAGTGATVSYTLGVTIALVTFGVTMLLISVPMMVMVAKFASNAKTSSMTTIVEQPGVAYIEGAQIAGGPFATYQSCFRKTQL